MSNIKWVFDLDDTETSKLFHYNNLVISLHPEVYEPAEDTFQLLEAIQLKSGEQVFEIGTGCGLIALECCRLGANVVCSDINPFAIELTRLNYAKNKHCLKGDFSIRKGALFSVLKKDELFDVIIFNPPYLPTKPYDRVGGTGWFDVATDGGRDGLNVTKRFINGLQSHLCKNGRIYFVFSLLSDHKKLETYLSKAGLKWEVLLSHRYDDEIINVYRVYFK
jgi:release factor glutamine methyltransferase